MKDKSKEISNVDVVLYALFKLGGVMKPIHTENIAWEAFQLAQERFSWRLAKYREKNFVDKTPVRFALEGAKKDELVDGRAGGDAGGELEGWSLTPSGVKWIKENKDRIITLLQQVPHQTSKRETERFIKRLKSDPLYTSYCKHLNLDDASIYMFTDMLVCAPDASKKIIRKKFEQLSSAAELIGNQDVINFLGACQNKFQDFIYE